MTTSKYFSIEYSEELKNIHMNIQGCKDTDSICFNSFLINAKPCRTVVVFETVNSLDESSLNLKAQALTPLFTKNLFVENNPMVSIESDLLKFTYAINANNTEIEMSVFALIETPFVMLANQTDCQDKFAYASKILTIYILFSKQQNTQLRPLLGYQHYDGYTHLGFFMGDLKLINEYLIAKDYNVNNNLLEAFTTTDIAEELFDEGLLILCWGMTRWAYFVQSKHDDANVYALPLGKVSNVKGYYRLRQATQRVSIVPGHALTDWQACLEQEWPNLVIDGQGEAIELSLSIIQANNEKGGHTVPIPIFFIKRTIEKVSISPLLNVNLFDINEGLE